MACSLDLKNFVEDFNKWVIENRKKSNAEILNFWTQMAYPIYRDKEVASKKASEIFGKNLDLWKKGNYDN